MSNQAPSAAPNSTESEFVTLISSDDYTFIIHRRSTHCSQTIRKMLDPRSGFLESSTARCKFENIDGVVLQKVVEYMLYNEKNALVEGVPDMPIEPEICLEMLLAADYLQI